MMAASKINRMTGGAAAVVLAGALAVGAPGAQAQTLIPGVTGCAAQGGKQEGGAVIGALLGGLLGNSVSGHNRTTGTVLGAAVGAAAGSAVGCQMQHNRAEAAYGYDDYRQPATYSRGGYRLSSAIAPANYRRMGETYVATRPLNLRAAPSTNSERVGSMRAGDRFQALANVRGTDWILVGQGGVGVGYVHGAFVEPQGYRYATAY